MKRRQRSEGEGHHQLMLFDLAKDALKMEHPSITHPPADPIVLNHLYTQSGKPNQAARGISVDAREAYSQITLPAILQKAYNSLPNPKTEINFSTFLRFNFTDAGVSKTYQGSTNASHAYDENVKNELQTLYRQHHNTINSGNYTIIAASPDPDFKLPVAQLQEKLRYIQRQITDIDNYDIIERPKPKKSDEPLSVGFYPKTNMDPTARELLEPVVRAYGGYIRKDSKGRDFISNEVFTQISKGEAQGSSRNV